VLVSSCTCPVECPTFRSGIYGKWQVADGGGCQHASRKGDLGWGVGRGSGSWRELRGAEGSASGLGSEGAGCHYIHFHGVPHPSYAHFSSWTSSPPDCVLPQGFSALVRVYVGGSRQGKRWRWMAVSGLGELESREEWSEGLTSKSVPFNGYPGSHHSPPPPLAAETAVPHRQLSLDS